MVGKDKRRVNVNIVKFFKTTWVMFDTLMVFTIFLLISLLIYGSGRDLQESRSFLADETSREREPRFQRSGFMSGQKTVSAAPVAYERAMAGQIARNMVISGVAALPVRQSMDMRESDSKYLVKFSLPKEVGEEHLNVEVAGNILTLMMESGQKTYMRRVRIPCDYALESSLNHFISNQVLFVEISKRPPSEQGR